MEAFFYVKICYTPAMPLNAIILAGGKGKRMNSRALPKVLHRLNGKPILSYTIDILDQIGIKKPIIIVGFQGQKIIASFGPNYTYIWQKKRLGTAHATAQAKSILKDKPGYTFVLYGDNPLILPQTLRRIIKAVEKTGAVAAISVAKAPDDLDLGVAVVDKKMFVKQIIERKVVSQSQLNQNPWRNSGAWLFDNRWLWQNIGKIKKNAAAREYYLTDIVDIALNQGKKVAAVPVADIIEAVGINTFEHLRQAHQWLLTKPKA